MNGGQRRFSHTQANGYTITQVYGRPKRFIAVGSEIFDSGLMIRMVPDDALYMATSLECQIRTTTDHTFKQQLKSDIASLGLAFSELTCPTT